MATWKKHIKMAKTRSAKKAKEGKGGSGGSNKNYASYLPSVYTGLSNRTDRYRQYDQMDQDPEISTGVDILADFCTQNDEDHSGPFEINYKDSQMGETEVTTLEDRLEAWVNLNDFKTRIFEIFRSVIKYGDQFFVRDPETYEWIWCDPAHVEKITVNESMGKEPTLYFIKDLSLNISEKVMTNQSVGMDRIAYPGAMPNALAGAGNNYGGGAANSSIGSGGSGGSAFPGHADQNTLPVDAEHIIHLSLSNGMDGFWPFGTSILENIFKTYKQKELLEDSIIIYRVQRAPERRVFKIDVGDLPEHMAMQYVERIKNEIHQRRIPSNKGGSTSLLDAAYNPLSILEDFFFPQTADGRGSDVTVLPGGDNLGQIDDLRWFNNKLIRGLKIPSSYLPFGPEDGGHVVNDGRVGQALIQEHRFNKYCQRLQATIIRIFDDEFKRYLEDCGYNISPNSFEINFRPPMNFASYRKAELEGSMIQTYASLAEFPFIARQTILKKMGWKHNEIIENERLWLQENPSKASQAGSQLGGTDAPGLSTVGVENPGDIQAEADPEADGALDAEGGQDIQGGSPITGNEQNDTF